MDNVCGSIKKKKIITCGASLENPDSLSSHIIITTSKKKKNLFTGKVPILLEFITPTSFTYKIQSIRFSQRVS